MIFRASPGSAARAADARPRAGARVLRRVGLLTAVTAMLASAAACGGGGGGSDNNSGGSNGGKVTIPLPVESRGLDPFQSSFVGTADSSRMAALYDFLVYLDPKTQQVQPRIAESLKPDDATGANWTLKIKPNVKFTDGTPYDAAAVKANWDANLDPKMKSLHASAATGVTSQIAGPLELKIKLATPNLNFDRVVAYGLAFIASPTAFRADPVGFAAKPVGAGPFMLKDWVRGDHQTMVRNPTYWQPGLPHLDQVTFKIMTDNDQILNAISTGEADLTVGSDGAFPEKAKAKGLESTELKLDGGQLFTFNLNRPPFNDVRARRAVAMALNPSDIMKTVFNGQTEPGSGIMRNGSTLLAPGTQQQPAYNPQEAQRLFNELAAEGKPVNFTFLTQQQATAKQTAEYMQSRLNQYKNVHMEIDAEEIGAYITKGLVMRDFQAQNYGLWEPDPNPGIDFMFRSTSKTNYAGYKSADADKALDAAMAATTPEQRQAAYTALVKVIGQDVPVFCWQEAVNVVVNRKSVTGTQLVSQGALVMDQLALK